MPIQLVLSSSIDLGCQANHYLLADFALLRTAVQVVENCTKFISRDDVADNFKEKLDLELERLRRGCNQLLGTGFSDTRLEKPEEGQLRTMEPTTPGVHHFSSEERSTSTVAGVKLLSAIVSHLTLITPRTIHHVSRAVESLIVLSRVSASNPSRYLQHALSVLASIAPPFSPEESVKYGDALRCISAAYWEIGTSLFHKDQFAAAIPYLIRMCEISTTLISLPKFENIDLETKTKDTKLQSASSRTSTIESIAAQLPKRWELLGFCQGRTGDRKVIFFMFVIVMLCVLKHVVRVQASYQAYLSGLFASRHTLTRIGEVAGTTPLSQLLAFEPMLRNTGKIVERITNLATFELLIPEQVSVLQLFEKNFSGTAKGMTSAELSGIGALVEYQYLLLLSSNGSRSQEAKAALSILLEHALRIYGADQFPIRRAR